MIWIIFKSGDQEGQRKTFSLLLFRYSIVHFEHIFRIVILMYYPDSCHLELLASDCVASRMNLSSPNIPLLIAGSKFYFNSTRPQDYFQTASGLLRGLHANLWCWILWWVSRILKTAQQTKESRVCKIFLNHFCSQREALIFLFSYSSSTSITFSVFPDLNLTTAIPAKYHVLITSKLVSLKRLFMHCWSQIFLFCCSSLKVTLLLIIITSLKEVEYL